MTTNISRRSFVAAASAGLSLLTTGTALSARQSETTEIESGGIGWPREVFEEKFGAGSDWNGMTVYTNPFVDGSELTVYFENDIATFIDMSNPNSRIDITNVTELLTALLPADAIDIGTWRINSVEGTPLWAFTEYSADSMNMAGSGATRMMITTAANNDIVTRATISLALPDAGSGFSPAEGSIGIGSTIDEWSSARGEGHDGHGAMGTYSGIWNVEPWTGVFVMSQRAQEGSARITQIDAISNEGVDIGTSIEFAEQILPQQSQLETGYSAYAVANRNQGWGMSTWQISATERVILCMIGTGDDSGDVLQVAAASYRGEV